MHSLIHKNTSWKGKKRPVSPYDHLHSLTLLWFDISKWFHITRVSVSRPLGRCLRAQAGPVCGAGRGTFEQPLKNRTTDRRPHVGRDHPASSSSMPGEAPDDSTCSRKYPLSKWTRDHLRLTSLRRIFVLLRVQLDFPNWQQWSCSLKRNTIPGRKTVYAIVIPFTRS